MNYLLQNSGQFKFDALRGNLLTIRRTAIKLERNRGTIMAWIKMGLLIPFSTEKIKVGKRSVICHWFLPSYIDKIKTVLPNAVSGGPVLDDNIISAIKAINKEMTRG